MSQYSQKKAFSEHMAKSYQESYNRASSMTFSERRNLTDAAFEIATKEQGYTMSEASRLKQSFQKEKDRFKTNLMVTITKIKECPPLAVIDIGTALKINGLYVVHVKSAADMPPLVFSCPGFTNIEMAILQAAVAVPGGWSISKGTLNGIYKEAVQRWDWVNNFGSPICILGFFDRLKVGNRLDINGKIIEIREYFFYPNLWIRRQVKMGRIKMGRKGRLGRFNRNRPRHCVNTHITIPD